MIIDVIKMNELIAQEEKVANLLYAAKLDLTNDDLDSHAQHYGEFLKETDALADMKSALLG